MQLPVSEASPVTRNLCKRLGGKSCSMSGVKRNDEPSSVLQSAWFLTGDC
jgi:hypothetical protein